MAGDRMSFSACRMRAVRGKSSLRWLRFLVLAVLLSAACSSGNDGALSIRLEYPQDGGAAGAPSSASEGDTSAQSVASGAARPSYVKVDDNRILIRVLAPHIPTSMEAWFDRSAGHGEITGIPPGDRIAVEVDEYDNTAVTLGTNAPLLGRGWAQGISLAAGEHKTVPVPMYDKGTIVRVCGAPPSGGAGTAGDTGDGGPATGALLGQPLAVEVGPDDSIYASSAQFNRIRRIDRYGYIAHYAGDGPHGSLVDGEPASTAPLGGVFDLNFDGAGDLYLITWWQEIIKVDLSSGTISIKYDGQPFNSAAKPDFAVVNDDTIYYTNGMDNRVYLVQGGVRSDYVADNLPSQTQEGADRLYYPLRAPSSVAHAIQYNELLFADRDNDQIKYVSFVNGKIYTKLSGTINRPNLVEFDPIHGRVFFSEEASNVLKMIDYTSGIKVVAGNGTTGFSGDGGPAASAQLSAPASVAVDSRGNVYIADKWNHAIRMVVGGALP